MKALKIFFIVLGLSGIVSLTYSQSSVPDMKSDSKVTLGAFGGLNVPKLSDGTNNAMSSGYSSRLGEAFGLTASYSLGLNFALRADLLYSSEGGQKNGTQAIEDSSFNPQAPAETYLYANYDNESILNYAEIPVMIKYSIPVHSSTKFYMDFGSYCGYLLNAQQKTSGTSLIYADKGETMPVEPFTQSFNATTDITNSINPFNFGLTGGVGLIQGVGYGNIFLDIRGAYGLTTVQKNSQDGSSHNGYVSIVVGYSIQLKY